MDDFITPNLVERTEEMFALYPEYLIDMEKALKESPFLVLRYRTILGSLANAIVHKNERRFKKAQTAYIKIYDKFKQLGLYQQE